MQLEPQTRQCESWDRRKLMGGWSRDWQAPGEQKTENTKLERGASVRQKMMMI